MQNIHIPRPEQLKKKLAQFNKTNFHLVADFDGTLTKAFINGKKVFSSYAYVRNKDYLGNEFSKISTQLKDHYRPIEFDPLVPQEEKNQKMEEWWTKHYELLIKHGMNLGIIKEILKTEKIELRQGYQKFFSLIKENQIPFLIFSAGFGNLIQEFFKLKDLLSPQTHIISNFISFDQAGKAVSYTRPLIHSFSKKEVQIKKFPYEKEITEKKNVILIGDTLGDTEMCQGVDHNTVIKIGFLNENTEELFDSYARAYDVLILNDGSLEYLNNLLKEIINL